MKVDTKEAFEIFETWKSSKAGLAITGPLESGFNVVREGKFRARIVEADPSSETLTVFSGVPGEIGSKEIRLELSGGSFDSDGLSALTVAFPSGRMLFFVKVSGDTGHTPVA